MSLAILWLDGCMHPTKAKEPWTGDRLQMEEIRKISKFGSF
jgi:hypothetical protein